jgi:flagellar basal-body rod protein FlgB
MLGLTGTGMGMLEKSMDFLWAKQAAILDNIANAETPNYKVKLVTFEEEFEQKLRAARSARGATSKSVREVIENAQWKVEEPQEQTRMDNNGVNVTEQSVELIRNAYQLQHVYQSISSHLSLMRTAING